MKHPTWYSTLRKICLAVGVFGVFFILLSNLVFSYQSLSLRIPSWWPQDAPVHSAFASSLAFYLTIFDWYILRPLTMLCLGFGVITGFEKRSASRFQYSYLVWFALALVLFIPCVICCGYGVASSIPPARSFIELLFREDILRTTMMLGAGILSGLGVRSLIGRTAK